MRQKSVTRATTPEQIVKDIRRATRKHHSAEEKIRVVLEGLRGEYSIADSLPAGGHCREPVLQLVEGVPGGREATFPRGTSYTCGSPTSRR
jgi:hypothetical protein